MTALAGLMAQRDVRYCPPPDVDLDFTKGHTSDMRRGVTPTFSGGANGSAVNLSGVISAASVGRLDYTTWTNKVKWSEDPSNAAWAKGSGGTGVAPVLTSGFIAPDGTPTAWRVQLNKGAGNTTADLCNLAANGDLGNPVNGVYTAWLKCYTGASAAVLFGSNGAPITITNQWQKYTSTGLGGSMRLMLRGTFGTPNTADLLFWHPQFDEGTVVNPYTYSGATPGTNGTAKLLVEEQRINYLLQTDDQTITGTWGGTPSRATTTDTFNGRPLTLIAKTASTGSESIGQTPSGCAPVAGATLVLTMALLAGSQVGANGNVSFGIRDVTAGTWGTNANSTGTILSGPGTLTQSSGALWVMANLSTVTPTLVQITCTFPTGTTSAGVYVYPGTHNSLTIGDNVKVGRFQLEPGAYATSYIPNGAAQLTRSADVVTIPTDWLNAAAGTFIAEFDTYGTPNVSAGICGTGPNSRFLYIGAGAQQVGSYDGTTVLQSPVVVTNGSTHRVAMSYGATGRSVVVDGGAVVTGALAAGFASGTPMYIGAYASGGQPLNGHIKRLRYWSIQLPDSVIQALTNLSSPF